QIYHPRTGRWTAAAPMAFPRNAASAVSLPDGRVLVAGGDDDHLLPQVSAEIYDPATRTWTETGNMHVARSHYGAAILPDGTVLVAGGRYTTDAAEIYHPDSGTWVLVAPMS